MSWPAVQPVGVACARRTVEAANLRVWLELTAEAGSTLQEQLNRERERADKIEEVKRRLSGCVRSLRRRDVRGSG